VALVTLGYALCMGAVNIVTGGNYLWLRHPPTGASLLDLLGPWPWYLLWMAVVGFAMLIVLEAPFAIARRRASRGMG